MMDDVDTQMVFENRTGRIKYPAVRYPTAAAALHACVRDLSHSRMKVLKVCIFDKPLYAYIEFSFPNPNKDVASIFGKLKPKKWLKDKTSHLKLDVVQPRDSEDSFAVQYQLMPPTSLGFDDAAARIQAL